MMHKSVHKIADDFDQWMKAGGDHAIKVVQDANLYGLFDRELKAVEEAAYKQGWCAAVKYCRENSTRAASLPSVPGQPLGPDDAANLINPSPPTGASST